MKCSQPSRQNLELVWTQSDHIDFISLTRQLDRELRNRYGDAQDALDGFNRIEPGSAAVVGYLDGEPVACGCFRPLGRETLEIKRMFVVPAARGCEHAVRLLDALEERGRQHGLVRALLETGSSQPEALALYEKRGYRRVENFGPYVNRPESICMAKPLHSMQENT